MGLRAIRNARESSHFLSDPVLVLGCGDGTEILAMLETRLISDVIGVEIVRERVNRGREAGLRIRRGDVDQLLTHSLGLHGKKFDIHASHVFEHCRNLDRSIFNVIQLMGIGNRVSVFTPIEPKGTGNKAHFSPISSLGFLFDKFADNLSSGFSFRVLFMEYRFDLELEGVMILEKIPFKKG
jgi:SAM-dependent methyltransferase